jgi:alpha-maltose-1-phosphate synthase
MVCGRYNISLCCKAMLRAHVIAGTLPTNCTTDDEMTPLTAAIYTGRPGRSPFDPTLWSSSSMRFFTTLKQRNLLHRVMGVELPWLSKIPYLLLNMSPNRARWKANFSFSASYRDALTRYLQKSLTPEDCKCPFFQIGAMFDMSRIADGRVPCYSYHDGCLAERISSPLPLPGVSRGVLDRALAFERRAHLGMTRIFTFSRYLREAFISKYGVPSERVAVIGGGINLDQLPTVDSNKSYDTQEVLFIGVDFARKGGEFLLRAFPAVRERHPRAVLHIVGPRKPATQVDTPGVTYHGFLSKQDANQAKTLEGLFRRASLFVMPSLYEPYGIAPLEAMSFGVPCVVSNGWALPEMVTPGVTGELVQPASVDSLVETLSRLLSSPDKLRAMGQAGRSYVQQEYSWERVVDRLVNELTVRQTA